jgi:hypothetical protein
MPEVLAAGPPADHPLRYLGGTEHNIAESWPRRIPATVRRGGRKVFPQLLHVGFG